MKRLYQGRNNKLIKNNNDDNDDDDDDGKKQLPNIKQRNTKGQNDIDTNTESNTISIKYETIRCKTNFLIKAEKKILIKKEVQKNSVTETKKKIISVSFKIQEQPPVQHIYVVKTSDKQEFHQKQKLKNDYAKIEIDEDTITNIDNLSIYCGIFEILFPSTFKISKNNEYPLRPLTATNFKYYEVPSMHLYKVRYGYDLLSSSIVFEIFLINNFNNTKDNKNKYEHIGVELRSRYGNVFKVGYGHISINHPIHIRFSPKELNQIGSFNGDDLLSICYSNDRLSEHNGLPISFGFNTNNNLIKLLRKFFELYLGHPLLFNEKSRTFFKKLSFEPTSVNMIDFYKIISSSNITKLITNPLNFAHTSEVLEEIADKLGDNNSFYISGEIYESSKNKVKLYNDIYESSFGFNIHGNVISINTANCIFYVKKENEKKDNDDDEKKKKVKGKSKSNYEYEIEEEEEEADN